MVIVSWNTHSKMKLNDADSIKHMLYNLAKHHRHLQDYNASNLHVHDACTGSAASKQPS